MESLIIEETESTPFIHLDKAKEVFEISGNSYPEDPTLFFQPVIQWISDYITIPNDHTEFRLFFDYVNSTSYKSIYDIVHLLEEIVLKNGKSVKINWIYKPGDTDILEAGNDLAGVVKIPFSISEAV